MLNMNMDFAQRVVIDTKAQPWIPSPKAGVWRKPLARQEAERGHATSIVRYDPGARFSSHEHPGGEEILVLDGIFSDETGDFSAGTYFRNPLGFRHTPFSSDGCLILVKLHQFQPDDDKRIAIKTGEGPWQDVQHGVRYQLLHEFKNERVTLVHLPAGAPGIAHSHPAGEELYVISGIIRDELGTYTAGTWLRSPPGSAHCPYAVEDALLWVKSGHLLPT